MRQACSSPSPQKTVAHATWYPSTEIKKKPHSTSPNKRVKSCSCLEDVRTIRNMLWMNAEGFFYSMSLSTVTRHWAVSGAWWLTVTAGESVRLRSLHGEMTQGIQRKQPRFWSTPKSLRRQRQERLSGVFATDVERGRHSTRTRAVQSCALPHDVLIHRFIVVVMVRNSACKVGWGHRGQPIHYWHSQEDIFKW